jgi:ferric-dicitrate binding protein FerR (iron transport regulator)
MKEELIQRFFKKECTAKEAMQVVEYLKANRALVDKYLSEEEWENVDIEKLPDEFWDDVWEKVQKKNKSKVALLWIKRTAVAVCTAAAIGAGYYHFTEPPKLTDRVAVNNLSQAKAAHRITENNSHKVMHILLQDNSAIDLSPNSVLRYDVPFNNYERKIFLEGEAYFKVAKDTSKPFTVFAGGLATTALGTAFKISANNIKHSIVVKLFEGKVIIKRTDSSFEGWDKTAYLLPGQQLEYDANKMLATILNTTSATSLKKQPLNVVKKKAPANDAGLIFNSTFLPGVFEKLSAYYNTKIDFNTKTIEKMSFTGTINKTDSLAVILKLIAQMNNLEIVEQDGGFLIQKR